MEAKLHLLSRKSRLLNFNRWIKHICFIKIKNNKLYKMSYVLDKFVVINCSWIGKDRSFFHGYINMFHYFFCLSPSVRMGTLQKVSKVKFILEAALRVAVTKKFWSIRQWMILVRNYELHSYFLRPMLITALSSHIG